VPARGRRGAAGAGRRSRAAGAARRARSGPLPSRIPDTTRTIRAAEAATIAAIFAEIDNSARDGRDRRSRRDRSIAPLAARQHGVVSAAQLLALGLSRKAIRSRVAAGRLHVIHAQVYAVGHPALGDQGRWFAAVLAGGPGPCSAIAAPPSSGP